MRTTRIHLARRRPMHLALPVLLALGMGGCSVDIGATGFVNDKVKTARISTSPPLLLPDGSCDGAVSLDPGTGAPKPTAIEPGIGECELVRLKGAKPDDVLIGESGKGQRETQVLYAEPGGRELYLFTDNKLTKIVKPGQG